MKIEDEEHFYHTKGLKRLLFLSTGSFWTIIITSIFALIALVLTLVQAFPELPKLLHLAANVLVPVAYAATESPADTLKIDYRPLINLAIMLAIGLAFVWSLAVCLHSDNANRVKTAGDLNKMLLGFLIGSGKSFLGL